MTTFDIQSTQMVRERKDEQVLIRMTTADREELYRLADLNGATVAGTIRVAIREYLAKEENVKKLAEASPKQ